MQLQPLNVGRCEPGISVQIGEILIALLSEGVVSQRRAAESRSRTPRPCDDCGYVTPDVDLWAEDSETGEQLWLCPACGDS